MFPVFCWVRRATLPHLCSKNILEVEQKCVDDPFLSPAGIEWKWRAQIFWKTGFKKRFHLKTVKSCVIFVCPSKKIFMYK